MAPRSMPNADPTDDPQRPMAEAYAQFEALADQQRLTVFGRAHLRRWFMAGVTWAMDYADDQIEDEDAGTL
jgi:hypothetical protein